MAGKAKRLTVGKFPKLSVEDARSEAREILIDMAAGVERKAEPTALTLRSALEQFLASRNIKPETKQCYRGLIERNLPDWLDLPLNEITKNMCEEKHKALIGPTRCGTQGKCRANRTFETLRTLMLWAADRYPALVISNPVERLNKNGQWFKLQARQGKIPDERLKEFYQHVMAQPKIARDYILFLLFSALRRREAACLRWADIDFAKGTLTVPMSKSQRPHVLPLTKMLTAILESRKGNGSEYVFEGRYAGHLQEPRAPIEQLRKQKELLGRCEGDRQ